MVFFLAGAFLAAGLLLAGALFEVTFFPVRTFLIGRLGWRASLMPIQLRTTPPSKRWFAPVSQSVDRDPYPPPPMR